MKEGTAVIDIEGQLRGLATQENKIITTDKINDLCGRLIESHYNIYELRLKSNKKYPSHLRIAGFRIRTTMGTIGIRLFDETSEYRDNFIKLVCENFYDSLLVHRVLPNYLIQMGAADTRYAKKDDVVGWQGPGYTLPMDIHKHLFHKRGMVAASKLPEDHNKSNRCDGSQFFIVAGRKFSEVDLRGIEKEYGKRFTSEQISAYTTIGGAPYLDGDYTVFAEVTEGMSVVDKIASVALNGDRPKIDIRIKDIEIIWR
jgi:cyclophilin family peptidyl-prolyl cis-trans isomerase